MFRKTFHFGPLTLRFNAVIAVFVLLAAGGLVRLGIWQLERAQEKIELQESYQELSRGEATPISNVPTAGREFDAIQHQNRRVSLSGRFLNDRSVFLIYQTYEEQLGFEVITPLAVEGEDLTVMVSRGWAGVRTSEQLQKSLPPVQGTTTVEGQIYVPSEAEAGRTSSIDEVSWPLVLRYLDIEEISAYFDDPVFPYVVRLAEDQPGVLVRHWPEVMIDTGTNYSYALQWFAMAIAVIIVSLILSSNILTLLRDRAKPL